MHTEARQAELKAAFERVQHKTNWKMPILAVIVIKDLDEQILIHDAVVHFTGSVPSFKLNDVHNSRNEFIVEAAGYYAAVGA